MAIPVIHSTTSVLGFLQWQTWQFQPTATNSPTGWSCENLPPGMSIDSTTGLISGFVTVPGVWDCPLVASNLSGDSEPLIIAIGIEATAYSPANVVSLNIDLETGHVSSNDGSRSSAKNNVMLWVKENDTLPILVRFFTGEAYVELTLSALKFGVKEAEPETLLNVGGGAALDTDFKKYGFDDSAYFLFIADFDGEALASALTNYEADTGTYFYALAEIEWQAVNPYLIGADPLIRTSRTFIVGIERDLIPN